MVNFNFSMSQLPTIKLLVLGSKNVGKSAVIVRFLTRRFIGEYRSNSDWLYKQNVMCENTNTNIEILDVSRFPNNDSLSVDQIRWADAFVIIYDICARETFTYAQNMLNSIRGNKQPSYVPIVLLGNKRDLEHSRKVDMDEGLSLAGQHGCQFAEVSAADNQFDVNSAIQGLIKETKSIQAQRTIPRHRKISIAVVSKAFGAVFGKHHNKHVGKVGRRMSFSL